MRFAPSSVVLSLALLGCTRSGGAIAEPVGTPHAAATPASTASPANTAAPPQPRDEPRDEAVASELQAIAKAYTSWGRVDDELRWAPFLCRMPMPGRPAFSVAATGGHAQKLYSLFAKDREGYAKKGTQAPGQVLVKESFAAERVEGQQPSPLTVGGQGIGDGDHFHPYVVRDGSTYRAGARMGLYVMVKKPGAAGNDAGWVYGTLAADGTVTSAGRVASCIGCHRDAPGDRLFGVKTGGY